MRLMGTHYWLTYIDSDDMRHIRKIGDIPHTYCDVHIKGQWESHNMRLDVPFEQVCPICFTLYSFELS